MKIANSVFRALVTACALTLVSVAAHAATINLKADLKASAEVPPKDSAGTGTLTGTLILKPTSLRITLSSAG